MLIDIVSKNGTMLLNVLQRPDGTIDDEARYILEELATWFPICGEAIYGTRPWRVFGEGDTRVTIDGFTENKTEWNSSDYRFNPEGRRPLRLPDEGPRKRRGRCSSPWPPARRWPLWSCWAPALWSSSRASACSPCSCRSKLPTQYTNCLKIQFA